MKRRTWRIVLAKVSLRKWQFDLRSEGWISIQLVKSVGKRSQTERKTRLYVEVERDRKKREPVLRVQNTTGCQRKLEWLIFISEMIACVEYSTKHTKKATKTNSDLDKVRKYKVDIKISIIFLYNSNEQLETKIKSDICNSIKIMKYLVTLCKKNVQKSHTKKYKTLQREIKGLNKWNGILRSWDWKTQYCKGVSFSQIIT